VRVLTLVAQAMALDNLDMGIGKKMDGKIAKGM
jgi:hypothetical protein